MTQAVLLMNLGTPSEPTSKGLRDFYRYFFSDPYVFDFNPVGRWLLRNLIILPFRAPRIAKDYAEIWMENGSPLKVYADEMETSLQEAFNKEGNQVLVRTGMAYSKPYVWDAMADLEAAGAKEILLLPMFPQYSTATTASIFNSVEHAAKKWTRPPKLHFVDDLFQEPAFLRAWASLIQQHVDIDSLDHIIFSYHGVPEKTIKKADKNHVCEFGSCCRSVDTSNRFCYRMQCVQTTLGITRELGWEAGKYSVAFQSRFGPLPWIKPYLDEHIETLVANNHKRIAVVTPSFISDCLETLFEIGVEYREQFDEAGGEEFHLVPNLNNDAAWFDAVHEIASKHLESFSRVF